MTKGSKIIAKNNAKAPITGLRTAKPADKRGPKAGSAMSNQSVKLAPEDKAQVAAEAKSRKAAPKINPDTITNITGVRSGPPHTIVETKKPDGSLGKCVAIPQNQFVGELTKLAKVGGSLKAVEDYIRSHKPTAKLANGITSRDAPHASKAVGDARGSAAKPAPATAPAKAIKAPKATTKPDDSRKLTFVAPNPKKAGSSTHARYAAAYKVGRTVAEVLKYTTRADIDWDLKRGFIKL